MATGENIKDYEDVTVYGLDPGTEDQLIAEQNELTFCWVTKDGSPMGVIMSYLRDDDGVFWMTASGQRKRIPAIRREPRVVLVITSPGTSMGPGRTVTYKGQATVLDDRETKDWFYPALAERLMAPRGPERVEEFAKMLDSPRRVVIRVDPGLRVGYDGRKMGAATKKAREAGDLSWDD
ncbi:MAG: pyridoxamine 5'-phosphate oxidase family protein [Actinomycetota bacterium]